MHVLHNGRPLTAQTVADLNVYFALVQRHQPIPKPLWARLKDAGIEAEDHRQRHSSDLTYPPSHTCERDTRERNPHG